MGLRKTASVFQSLMKKTSCLSFPNVFSTAVGVWIDGVLLFNSRPVQVISTFSIVAGERENDDIETH